MDTETNPYLSRRVRVTRAVAIIASWSIWLAGLYVALSTHIPQGRLLLTFVLGFAPYIVSIQLVEPWIIRRAASVSRNNAQDPRDDG